MVGQSCHRNVLYVVIKKSRFMKEQESKELLSSLGLQRYWIKFHYYVTFCFNSVEYKMKVIVSKFILAGDKIMPEMYLTQPGFAYSACGPFTKNKERIEKFMQKENMDYIYKNDLDKSSFQHDMAYGKYKDLNKRKKSDKVLRHKAFELASDPKYDAYQWGLASMIYKFFDEKSTGSDVDFMPNQPQLANELHKPILGKF